MKVFVTGVDGYIGAVLAPYLMHRGLEVLGLDTGYYRDGWLYSDNRRLAYAPQTLNKDLRDITEADLLGCDAVAHLAELSNDPLGQNNPAVTHRINHRGSVSLAEKARSAGISRFVYTSSCSVYGAGTGDFLDESSADQSADGVRRMQGPRRARSRRHGRSDLLPGLPAQRDGVRTVAANALRHRPERSCGAGLDDEAHRHDQRRQPMAAAGARRGHLRSDLPIACCAGRRCPRQDLQRRAELRKLSHSRNRRKLLPRNFPDAK